MGGFSRLGVFHALKCPTLRGQGVGAGTPDMARIVSRSPTRVTIAAIAARDGYLVLGESWAPGWQAWVDGRPAPVLRANYVHRAVALSAGRHQVEFRYLPSAFRLGLYISVSAIAVLLALATARLGRPA
jgi:uncharacterized membrane protein YfhO